MAKITAAIGGILILLGIGFYFGTGSVSWTALIPALFGLPVAILGFVGIGGSEAVRKHTAHAAVMITLLGTLGGFGMGIRGALDEAKGLNAAAIEQLLMGVICLVHVILSVRSFIAARKARQAAEA